DTLVPAFTIRRLGRSDHPGSDAIVFEAGCSPERVGVAVDHMPPHGPRWRNVFGAEAKHTECNPPVDALEASFVHFVNAGGGIRSTCRRSSPCSRRIGTRRSSGR